MENDESHVQVRFDIDKLLVIPAPVITSPYFSHVLSWYPSPSHVKCGGTKCKEREMEDTVRPQCLMKTAQLDQVSHVCC